jgi:glycine/D-amino acid oxidase-like deaminating enzyme
MRKADPKALGSSWYSATRVASPPRGALTIELDVDVCIIGAGLAGLTAAREVARRGWSVVVLEAESVAWNASGRNTGFVMPGYSASPAAIVERVGLDHARKLWLLSEAGAEYIREAAQEKVMDGVALTEGGWLRVSKLDDDPALHAEANLLKDEFGAAVELWPADLVRETLRSPHYFEALHHPRAFSLHPLNYALGLAALAEAAGARIFEDTEALEIDPAGVRKRISTKNSRVRAGHVVLAGNVHLAGLMPQFANTLQPAFNYVIATAPLGDALHDAIRYTGGVSDSDLADNHYRVVDRDRLLWSGRSTVWRGKPQRYVETLLGQIRRAYPQLAGVKAEYGWTGVTGHTVHHMPQIGEITPGLWLLSGFGNHGLNTTAMGGEMVAKAIVDGDTTWKAFQPFELVWAGGMVGRAAKQARHWRARSSEAMAARMARRREDKRRRTSPGMPKLPAMKPADEIPAVAEAEPAPAAAPEIDVGNPPPQPEAELVPEATAALTELARTAKMLRKKPRKDAAAKPDEAQASGESSASGRA